MRDIHKQICKKVKNFWIKKTLSKCESETSQFRESTAGALPVPPKIMNK